MTTLNVNAGQSYRTLSEAIAASKDGDIIEVSPGTYINDFATINTKITIKSISALDMVNLVALASPPNGKAILTTNTDVTLDGISFSGAKVTDGNGAGIRYQGGHLIINNCYFHHNQEGLLAADSRYGSITITNTEFAHNGTGDGRTHNLYVGMIGRLTISKSYFHDTVVGHEIKSRALVNIIQNNRIFEDSTGTASYSIDLPNGGYAAISGNVLHQGSLGQNPAMIHYGGEGTPHAKSILDIRNNKFINDMISVSSRALLNHTTVTAVFYNNSVYGLPSNQLVTGPASITATTFLATKPLLDTTQPF